MIELVNIPVIYVSSFKYRFFYIWKGQSDRIIIWVSCGGGDRATPQSVQWMLAVHNEHMLASFRPILQTWFNFNPIMDK